MAELGGVPHQSLADDTVSVEVTLPDAPRLAAPCRNQRYTALPAVAQGVADLIEPGAHTGSRDAWALAL